VLIGYETSEQLDVEPARYFVLVTQREKRACPRCPEAGVAVAPAPPRIVDKGLGGDRAVTDIVVGKYVDHLSRLVGTCRRIGRACGWSGRQGSRFTGPRWMVG